MDERRQDKDQEPENAAIESGELPDDALAEAAGGMSFTEQATRHLFIPVGE